MEPKKLKELKEAAKSLYRAKGFNPIRTRMFDPEVPVLTIYFEQGKGPYGLDNVNVNLSTLSPTIYFGLK